MPNIRSDSDITRNITASTTQIKTLSQTTSASDPAAPSIQLNDLQYIWLTV